MSEQYKNISPAEMRFAPDCRDSVRSAIVVRSATELAQRGIQVSSQAIVSTWGEPALEEYVNARLAIVMPKEQAIEIRKQ